MDEHICEIHGCEMEWVCYDQDLFGSDGCWFCQQCWEDEEYRQRIKGDE